MFKRLIALFVIISFIFSYYQPVYAQDFNVNELPVPGTMVGESAPFAPLALKGLVINLRKPLEFQFIVDTGKGPQDTASVKNQANQLVKYFLAGLTIPEGDLWVNLSPYEKNRMVPAALGQTDLGRDLLAQDYILKQLTASLIYPEKDLGKEFWAKVYTRAQKEFGTTNVPVNTFNKVWILPDQAQVFEHGAAAYVTKATLKVMLDEDYIALQKHMPVHNNTDSIGSQIIREIVLPEITKEVNTGKNFAPLRQIYQALILAKWYKETIQNGLLDAVYTNKSKVAGVNLNDPSVKEQIYNRYLQAYKKGAFNYIKEDSTPDGQPVPRKYFSGGFTDMGMIITRTRNPSLIGRVGKIAVITENLKVPKDAAMMAFHLEGIAEEFTREAHAKLVKDVKLVKHEWKEHEYFENNKKFKKLGGGSHSAVYVDPKDKPGNFYKVFRGPARKWGLAELRNLTYLQRNRYRMILNKQIPQVLEWGLMSDRGIWIHMSGIKKAKSIMYEVKAEGEKKESQLLFSDIWTKFSFSKQLDILAQVAEILQLCHGERVSYNDLKPYNIIVNENGQVMIIDWGTATAFGESQSEGSPKYASNDRVMRDESDVYSLYVTMNEVLTVIPANMEKVKISLEDLGSRMNQQNNNAERISMQAAAISLRAIAQEAARIDAAMTTEQIAATDWAKANAGTSEQWNKVEDTQDELANKFRVPSAFMHNLVNEFYIRTSGESKHYRDFRAWAQQQIPGKRVKETEQELAQKFLGEQVIKGKARTIFNQYKIVTSDELRRLIAWAQAHPGEQIDSAEEDLLLEYDVTREELRVVLSEFDIKVAKVSKKMRALHDWAEKYHDQRVNLTLKAVAKKLDLPVSVVRPIVKGYRIRLIGDGSQGEDDLIEWISKNKKPGDITDLTKKELAIRHGLSVAKVKKITTKSELRTNGGYPDLAMLILKHNPDITSYIQANKGGIDLNQIKVNRTGKIINVQFDQAQLNALEQDNFKGFTPVITGFEYIKSPFPLLLGTNTTNLPERLAKV